MGKIQFKVIETPEDFQILDFILTNDGVIEPNELKTLILPPNIDYTKGVVINGRGPIWLYSYLTHQLHIAAYVATFDPRIGAIVVQSHKANTYRTGDVIEIDRISQYLPKIDIKTMENPDRNKKLAKVIAFIGPPHSGKSVFLKILRDSLFKYIDNEFFQREFFIIRGCPDGEGLWFEESHPEIVKQIKYKNNFNQDFVNKIIESINGLKTNKKLLFVDCGGIIDKFNMHILSQCTDAIIISNDTNETLKWEGAAKLCDLNIIAYINSSLDSINEIISKEPLIINLGPFKRHLSTDFLSSTNLPNILIEKVLNGVYEIKNRT